ncbi:MAG: PAS domain-containing protein [Gemmatimonadota bacterium]
MSAPIYGFPRPLLVVDGALKVVEWSRRGLLLFGVGEGDEAAPAAAALTAALAAEESLADELALATARLTRPGEEENVAWTQGGRIWEVSMAALEGGEGAPDRFLVRFEDVTRRRLAEEIQLNARHYLEQLLSHIPMGVVVLNGELRVTSANPRMLDFLGRMGSGGELAEVIGGRLPELVPGEVGAHWESLCRGVAGSGEPASAGRRSFGSAEGELVLAVEMTALRDHGGTPTGVILVADDVSEQARLERELVRAEKLATVGQMVITVNHEINNPLTIIAANAQSLRLLGRDLDDKTQRKLEAIEKQVKRISAVTARLRTMDEVASSEYIEAGPTMIDVWRRRAGEAGQGGER